MHPPKTTDPWRKVTHDGVEYLVRYAGKVWWVVRLPERDVWMFDERPEWL